MQSVVKTSLFSLTSTTGFHPQQYPHQMCFSERCGWGLPGAESLPAAWARQQMENQIMLNFIFLSDAISGQMGVFSSVTGTVTGRRCDGFEAGSTPTGMGWEELTSTWDYPRGTSCPTASVPIRWRSQLEKQEMTAFSQQRCRRWTFMGGEGDEGENPLLIPP